MNWSLKHKPQICLLQAVWPYSLICSFKKYLWNTYHMAGRLLDQLADFVTPQFPHLKNGVNNTHLPEFCEENMR